MKTEEYLQHILLQYRLIQVLSQKNGARVLRLRHSRLERDMVVRIYQIPVPAYDMLKTVKHRNLPEIYETIRCEDGQIVLEQYIDGLSAADVLETGTYTYAGAKAVLIGVCTAVQTLHTMRIVHRDIKPENVMLTRDGTVKLIDLNASREMTNTVREKDTVIMGTVGYAPPEQFGIGNSDTRADIYALGVLLNVMLTGEHPSRILAKGKARRIVEKCTLIAPQSRFSSIDKFMKAL